MVPTEGVYVMVNWVQLQMEDANVVCGARQVPANLLAAIVSVFSCQG